MHLIIFPIAYVKAAYWTNPDISESYVTSLFFSPSNVLACQASKKCKLPYITKAQTTVHHKNAKYRTSQKRNLPYKGRLRSGPAMINESGIFSLLL